MKDALKIRGNSYKLNVTITPSQWITSTATCYYDYSYPGIQSGDEFYYSPKDSSVDNITVPMLVEPDDDFVTFIWKSATPPTANITVAGRIWHY